MFRASCATPINICCRASYAFKATAPPTPPSTSPPAITRPASADKRRVRPMVPTIGNPVLTAVASLTAPPSAALTAPRAASLAPNAIGWRRDPGDKVPLGVPLVGGGGVLAADVRAGIGKAPEVAARVVSAPRVCPLGCCTRVTSAEEAAVAMRQIRVIAHAQGENPPVLS